MNRPYTGTPSIKGLALVGLLIFGGYQIFKTVDNKDWPEVTGKVTNIRVDESYRYRTTRYNSGHYEYTGVVEYIYLVDHVSHQDRRTCGRFTRGCKLKITPTACIARGSTCK